MKHVQFFLITGMLIFLLVLSGCSGSNFVAKTPTPTPTPTSTPTPTPTPTPTSTPIPTSTPTPTPIPTPEVFTDEELLQKSPQIEGYTPKVETLDNDVKVVNLVNNETKEVDYIYNPYVYVGDKQVGGIAVKPDKMVEMIGDKTEIIVPFNIKEIGAKTNFRIENTNNLVFGKHFNKEWKTLMVEFDGELTFINPYTKDNQFCPVDEFNFDMEYKKEDGTIINFEKQAGLSPFECLDAQDEGRTKMGMEDYYYDLNVKNQDQINSFNKSIVYSKGQETPVQVEKYLVIYFDYFNYSKETTTDDLAKDLNGMILFAYPVEATD